MAYNATISPGKLSRADRLTLACVIALGVASLGAAAPSPSPSPSPSPAAKVTLTKQLSDQLVKIREASLKSNYALKQTAYLCNNIGPRLSGSAQAARAVDYVAAEMERLGLKVTKEPVMVPHWVRGEETGEIITYAGQVSGTTQKLVLTALGGSIPTGPGGLTAPVVVVGDFAELERLGKAGVTGKIVLFNVRFDPRLAEMGHATHGYGRLVGYRWDCATAAGKLGAVGALVRSVGHADYRLPHTGSMGYEEGVPRIPGAAVAAEDADLLATLTQQGPVVVHLKLGCQILPDVQSANVIADLPGRELPDEYVLVSGHLDSWDLGTGAIDDAGGVAMAMQTAAVLSQLHIRPRRTIRVVAWMNEENGGAGFKAFGEDYKKQIPQHMAAIESDLGVGHPIGFTVHASAPEVERAELLMGLLSPIGATLMRESGRAVASDLEPLEENGVAGFSLLQDQRTYFAYHHTAADTFDKIDPVNLAESATVVTVLAAGIADWPGVWPKPRPH